MRVATHIAVLVLAMIAARSLHAQTAKPSAEVRVDALFGAPRAVQAGAGFTLPLGYYARLTTIGAYGESRANGVTAPSARVEVLLRFLLDPFREYRYGLSAGGGVSVRDDRVYGWRPFLTVVADLELPRHGAWAPAIQAGLGGGARVGLVIRSAQEQFR